VRSVLTLSALCKSYGEKTLFSDLNCEVLPGAHWLIQGPSGVGKTTLLNLIGRLDSPDSGTCLFEGKPYEEWGPAAAFRLNTIGFLFQGIHLVQSLTVLQNLQLIRTAAKADVDPMGLLQALGIADLANQSVLTLSRGEAQRVAMARAFANAPKLILADEPTSSLDPANRDLVLNLLFSLCAQTGATVVVVSHSPIVAQRPEFTQRLNL